MSPLPYVRDVICPVPEYVTPVTKGARQPLDADQGIVHEASPVGREWQKLVSLHW